MPRKLVIVTAAVALPVMAAVVAVWIMAAKPPAVPPMASLEDAMSNPTGWEWLMPPQEIDGDRAVRTLWLSDESHPDRRGHGPRRAVRLGDALPTCR